MSRKVLVATEKPFAKDAVIGIQAKCKEQGYECILLEKYTDHADLVNAVKDVDALIIRSDKVKQDVIENGDNLKIVVRAGAGYDNVDLAAASAKNVVVMNTPGQNSNAVAELAIGMMVFMARNKFNGKAGSELKGKTLGIHAYGNVGRNTARIAQGFGMNVCAFDPFIKAEVMEADGVKAMETMEEMYAQCDYVSLNLPLVDATRNAIHYKLMKTMKPGACIVNTARKEVVCEDGLKMMLAERPDFKYLSDIAPVCAEELMEKFADQVFFTPKKMGAQTKEANVNAGIAAINQIIGYFEENDTTFQVNK
jgi:D-3-phosphoglycerate dehydrogenase